MSNKAYLTTAIFSAIISLSGYILTCLWFGWKAVIVVFLLKWAANIDARLLIEKRTRESR